VIDPFGRVRAEIGLGEKGIIDADLPKASPSTLFVQVGSIVEIAMLALAAIGWLTCRIFR
jgi:apolipoprotein N-acyltransferase